jgi:translation initiation factor 5
MEANNHVYLTSDETVLFDANYRYKIRCLEYAFALKKGTQITILTNLTEFATQLQYQVTVLIKIIGKKLSCKTGIDKSTNQYYLQGLYTPNQVNKIIYDFIKSYLLCSQCDKPEVILTTNKGVCKQKCKACGYKGYITGDETINEVLVKLA